MRRSVAAPDRSARSEFQRGLRALAERIHSLDAGLVRALRPLDPEVA